MACVTLKRPLDFDPLEVLHSPNRPSSTKRRRCTPIKNVDSSSEPAGSHEGGIGRSEMSLDQSVFRETPLNQEDITKNLKNELKRLKRRKDAGPRAIPTASSPTSKSLASILPDSQNAINSTRENESVSSVTTISAISSQFSNASISSFLESAKSAKDTKTSCDIPTENNSSVYLSSAPSTSANPFATNINTLEVKNKSEKKVFTLKEMTLICEKMCKERTDAVRQEYDKILHQKLSEQYDAFVKFIDHQIQQRFNESQLPSYLS